MRILMISGDTHALDPHSAVYGRLRLMAREAGRLDVLVPGKGATSLGENGAVFGCGSSRWGSARAMYARASRERYDIVTAQDPFLLGLVAWIIARRQGARVQFQLHTDALSRAFRRASVGNFFRFCLARLLLPRADSIRVVSERIARSLSDAHITVPVSVTPIFIDGAPFLSGHPAHLAREYPQFTKRILIAARLEKEKRVDMLLRVMRMVSKADSSVGLFIAGDGSQRAALAHMSRLLGLSNKVVFLGYRSDVAALFKSADLVLAATAPYEGYGATTVEALAAGCAVVSPDVGAAREAGAIIAEDTIASLANATLTALRHNERGELRIVLPTEKEWAHRWYEGLAAAGARPVAPPAGATTPRASGKNLLIVTQAVDREDPALGFFHRWIEEFAKHRTRVTVICLREGVHDLPGNVRVVSLGKEKKASRMKIFFTFFSLLFSLRPKYDEVFVHMNPEYVVLGGWWWKMRRTPIVLWYVHRSVTLTLRVACMLADHIATSAPESFGITSAKVHYLGHGIDVARFRGPIRDFHQPLRIVSVGRITPIKHLEVLVEAAHILLRHGTPIELTFLGAPAVPSDHEYREGLDARVKEYNLEVRVHFAGSVPYRDLPDALREFDVSVNLAPTGGMDKAVLESMAAGLLTFVSNEAFTTLLGPHAPALLFRQGDAQSCADHIVNVLGTADHGLSVRRDMAARVETMSIDRVVGNILSLYDTSN